MRLQGLTPERPLTHDLFASALEARRGARRRGSSSPTSPRRRSTPGSSSSTTGGSVEVDARPSDALALAVRVGARDLRAPSVLDQAGLGADGGLGEEDDEGGGLLETTGEQIVDPRLDVFRDFVNSLDVDPDAEGRGS